MDRFKVTVSDDRRRDGGHRRGRSSGPPRGHRHDRGPAVGPVLRGGAVMLGLSRPRASSWRSAGRSSCPSPARSSSCAAALARRPTSPRDAPGTVGPGPGDAAPAEAPGLGRRARRVLRHLDAGRLAARARTEPRPGAGPDRRCDRTRRGTRSSCSPRRTRAASGASSATGRRSRASLILNTLTPTTQRRRHAEPHDGVRRALHRSPADLRAEGHLHDDRAGPRADALVEHPVRGRARTTSRSTTS